MRVPKRARVAAVALLPLVLLLVGMALGAESMAPRGGRGGSSTGVGVDNNYVPPHTRVVEEEVACPGGFACAGGRVDVADGSMVRCPAGFVCAPSTVLGEALDTPCPQGRLCRAGTASAELALCPRGFFCGVGTGGLPGEGAATEAGACPIGTTSAPGSVTRFECDVDTSLAVPVVTDVPWVVGDDVVLPQEQQAGPMGVYEVRVDTDAIPFGYRGQAGAPLPYGEVWRVAFTQYDIGRGPSAGSDVTLHGGVPADTRDFTYAFRITPLISTYTHMPSEAPLEAGVVFAIHPRMQVVHPVYGDAAAEFVGAASLHRIEAQRVDTRGNATDSVGAAFVCVQLEHTQDRVRLPSNRARVGEYAFVDFVASSFDASVSSTVVEEAPRAPLVDQAGGDVQLVVPHMGQCAGLPAHMTLADLFEHPQCVLAPANETVTSSIRQHAFGDRCDLALQCAFFTEDLIPSALSQRWPRLWIHAPRGEVLFYISRHGQDNDDVRTGRVLELGSAKRGSSQLVPVTVRRSCGWHGTPSDVLVPRDVTLHVGYRQRTTSTKQVVQAWVDFRNCSGVDVAGPIDAAYTLHVEWEVMEWSDVLDQYGLGVGPYLAYIAILCFVVLLGVVLLAAQRMRFQPLHFRKMFRLSQLRVLGGFGLAWPVVVAVILLNDIIINDALRIESDASTFAMEASEWRAQSGAHELEAKQGRHGLVFLLTGMYCLYRMVPLMCVSTHAGSIPSGYVSPRVLNAQDRRRRREMGLWRGLYRRLLLWGILGNVGLLVFFLMVPVHGLFLYVVALSVFMLWTRHARPLSGELQTFHKTVLRAWPFAACAALATLYGVAWMSAARSEALAEYDVLFVLLTHLTGSLLSSVMGSILDDDVRLHVLMTGVKVMHFHIVWGIPTFRDWVVALVFMFIIAHLLVVPVGKMLRLQSRNVLTHCLELARRMTGAALPTADDVLGEAVDPGVEGYAFLLNIHSNICSTSAACLCFPLTVDALSQMRDYAVFPVFPVMGNTHIAVVTLAGLFFGILSLVISTITFYICNNIMQGHLVRFLRRHTRAPTHVWVLHSSRLHVTHGPTRTHSMAHLRFNDQLHWMAMVGAFSLFATCFGVNTMLAGGYNVFLDRQTYVIMGSLLLILPTFERLLFATGSCLQVWGLPGETAADRDARRHAPPAGGAVELVRVREEAAASDDDDDHENAPAEELASGTPNTPAARRTTTV